MSDVLAIKPVDRPVVGRIRPPGSKSLTNRALIIAASAQGESYLQGVLDSVDTQVMVQCLQHLGIAVDADFARAAIRVDNQRSTPQPANVELYCENSGTSIRFLTALCAVRSGHVRLDGTTRMRERPIGPLVEALAGAGVDIRCELDNQCPPVVMDANGLTKNEIDIAGSLSSQYLSGLLMVAPTATSGLTIRVQGELVSRPYIDMTLEVMRSFGASISELQPNEFSISPTGYTGREYAIEPDASAASYFFAVAAITGGEVTVEGLHRDSLQGDIGFVDALIEMGCEATWRNDSVTVKGRPLHGIDIDMNQISDTAQTLACVAPFADGPTRIRNIAHNRVKETDRISAVVTELNRAGIQAVEHDDGMTIPPGKPQPAKIQTYDDHRMAMSFALLGLKSRGIEIADPGCTAKTYPRYFDDLAQLCQGVH